MISSMAHGADTQKIDIDNAYKDEAFKRLQNLVKGNKLDPSDVTLEKFEGEILHFEAQTILTVSTKISLKTVGGRVNGPLKVDSSTTAHDAIHRDFRALFNDTPTQDQIKSTLLTRPDKGLAAQNIKVDLPFWKKEYVVLKPCHGCKTTGTVRCLPCDGKGVDQCPRCHGSGMGQCTHCNGAQMVQGPNNSRVQCTMCHGRGKVSCALCSQSGRITCKTCRSSGTTTCPNCNGNAWSSDIHIGELTANTHFEYPRDVLPDKIVAMIDRHGAKISEHASIIIPPKTDILEGDSSDDLKIPIIYDITLPYAHMEYEIEGKTYYTFLFGKTGALEHVSPFLDDVLQDGVRKLNDGADNRGDVSHNLRAAAEYKTLRQGIIYAALHSLKNAKTKLLDVNPLGLSDDMAATIVTNADKALKNITHKPRTVGLGISALFNAVLFALYCLSPLRHVIVSKIGNTSLHFVLDIIMLAATCYIGALIIQTMAQSATKALMKDILPKQSKITAPAKIGDKAYWNMGASVGIFLIMVELSRHIAAHPVSWWASLFG